MGWLSKLFIFVKIAVNNIIIIMMIQNQNIEKGLLANLFLFEWNNLYNQLIGISKDAPNDWCLECLKSSRYYNEGVGYKKLL